MISKKAIFLLASSLVLAEASNTGTNASVAVPPSDTKGSALPNSQKAAEFFGGVFNSMSTGAGNLMKQIKDATGHDAVPFKFAFVEVEKLAPHDFDKSVADHSCRPFSSFEDMVKAAYEQDGGMHLGTVLYCPQSLKPLQTFSASDIITAAGGVGHPDETDKRMTEIVEALRLKAERLKGLYREATIRSNYYACLKAMEEDLKSNRKSNENYPCGAGAACTDRDIDAYKATLLSLSQCKSDQVPSMPEQIEVFAEQLKSLGKDPNVTGKQFADAVSNVLVRSRSWSGSAAELRRSIFSSLPKIGTGSSEKAADGPAGGSVKDIVSARIVANLSMLEKILGNWSSASSLEAVKETDTKASARKGLLAADLNARVMGIVKDLKALFSEASESAKPSENAAPTSSSAPSDHTNEEHKPDEHNVEQHMVS